MDASDHPLPRTQAQRLIEFFLIWLTASVISGVLFATTWSIGSLVFAGGLVLLIAAMVAQPSQDRGRFVRAVIAGVVGVVTPVALLILLMMVACPVGGCWS